ncbi:MAG: SMC-Scp complex subunit ScpB [Candidatus Thermoplasmatota archaeon]|nr:SMC-Scp complex subunit ScpB [Candidatus Thermoplasmatota archaeon]
MKKNSNRIVEAALFSAGRPISVDEICDVIHLKKREVVGAVTSLMDEYETRGKKGETSIEVSKAGDKYAMQLRSEYAEYGKKLSGTEVPKKLLKTVSLIAYYQPVVQSEIKNMVGSKIYEHARELEEFGFIKSRKHGRTKILETTTYFYEYFGFDTTDRGKIREYLKNKIKLPAASSGTS